MSRRLVLRLLLAAAVVAAAAFLLVQWLRPTVIVERARRANAADAAATTLTVLAARSTVIASEVGGRIAVSNLGIGREVKEGEVLVEIDPSDLQLEIAQNKNDIAATRQKLEQGSSLTFELANERQNLANKEELFNRGSVARAEVDRSRATVETLEFRIKAETAALEQQLATYENSLAVRELRLSKMKVIAPIDGVITRVMFDRGDLIGGGATIAELISNQRLVEARVSEEDIAGIKVGQKAIANFLPYGAWGFNATVEKILPAADPLTQRYTVYLKVDIEPARLIPGITGQASIERARRENALVIPRTALLGNRVFVANGGRVGLRDVEVGITSLNLVEITKGLQEGDLVAVEGLDLLRDGERVRVAVRESAHK